MNTSGIYQGLKEARERGEKRLAVLLDPDKIKFPELDKWLDNAVEAGVDYFFVGGSLLLNNQMEELLLRVRAQCAIPLVLFPGNTFQVSNSADAILLLSLISGRNPEFLIGQHVLAAPFLRQSKLEVISTGYMLIDGGVRSSVEYMSNTLPIPAAKTDIAVSTALAGEMLGLKMLYLEAGSGAMNAVPEDMVSAVRASVSLPLIVGGGIRTPEKAAALFRAGVDLLVVGTAFERDPALIGQFSMAKYSRRD